MPLPAFAASVAVKDAISCSSLCSHVLQSRVSRSSSPCILGRSLSSSADREVCRAGTFSIEAPRCSYSQGQGQGQGQGTVFYFAYASNLSPKVLGPDAELKLRQVEILSTTPASLPDHHLTFFPTGLPSEPAMATVLPSGENVDSTSRAQVPGVVFEMSSQSFNALCRSEAVLPSSVARPRWLPLPFAEVVSVRVKVFRDAAACTKNTGKVQWLLAKTFMWRSVEPLVPFASSKSPSARYLGLIYHGYEVRGLGKPIFSDSVGRAKLSSVFTPDETPGSSVGGHGVRVGDPVTFALEALEQDSKWADSQKAPSHSVRLVRLTQENGMSAKPVLFYIPGIDGSGYSIVSQIPSLTQSHEGAPEGFDIYAARVPFESRESWRELADSLLTAFADVVTKYGTPYTVVLGESMGGAIVQHVGLENGRRSRLVIDQLVMVNPASCFRRSELSTAWIELSSRVPPTVYERLVGPLLIPFILDISSIPLTELRTTGMRRLEKLRSFLARASDLLPQDAILHRLKMLNSFRMTPADYEVMGMDGAGKVRIVIAENDSLLPVVEESVKLLELVPGMERACFPFGGHALLQDSRVDLGSLLMSKPAISRGARSDGGVTNTVSSSHESYNVGGGGVAPPGERTLARRVQDASWAAPDRTKALLPRRSDRDALERKFDSTRRAHAPVVLGTERLPDSSLSRPVLFVSNHTLLGSIEAVLLMSHVLDHRQKLVRSLAHPALFSVFGNGNDANGEERSVRLPGLEKVTLSDMKKFGISPVSPRALVRELSNNNWVLVFPGGAREALKRKTDRRYGLHWPETVEVIRSAAAFGAVIIPVATVGQEDSVNVILDSAEVASALKSFSESIGWVTDISAPPPARPWRGTGDETEIVPYLGVPSIPDRVYLRFGDPIEVPMRAKQNKELAARIYKGLKKDVEDGIDVLLDRRRHDGYRSFQRRLAFRSRHGDSPPPVYPAWTWENNAGPIDA